MFNLTTGKSYFKKLSRTRNSAAFKSINPRRDWAIILIVFLLLVIGFVLFGTYLFLQIDSGAGIFGTEESSTIIDTINRTLLNDVLDFYKNKSIQFEILKDQAPVIIDLSL